MSSILFNTLSIKRFPAVSFTTRTTAAVLCQPTRQPLLKQRLCNSAVLANTQQIHSKKQKIKQPRLQIADDVPSSAVNRQPKDTSRAGTVVTAVPTEYEVPVLKKKTCIPLHQRRHQLQCTRASDTQKAAAPHCSQEARQQSGKQQQAARCIWALPSPRSPLDLLHTFLFAPDILLAHRFPRHFLPARGLNTLTAHYVRTFRAAYTHTPQHLKQPTMAPTL